MNQSVYSNQKVFKSLMQSISRPGRIIPFQSKIQQETGELYNLTLQIAECLLDAEVSFHISNNDSMITNDIRSRTLSQSVSLNSADYIFIPNGSDDLINCIKGAKVGSLIMPENNATLVLETTKITNEKYYELSGPGVKDKHYFNYKVRENWLDVWKERNKEFPIGIDMIITDGNHILSITRTSQIKEVS